MVKALPLGGGAHILSENPRQVHGENTNLVQYGRHTNKGGGQISIFFSWDPPNWIYPALLRTGHYTGGMRMRAETMEFPREELLGPLNVSMRPPTIGPPLPSSVSSFISRKALERKLKEGEKRREYLPRRSTRRFNLRSFPQKASQEI